MKNLKLGETEKRFRNFIEAKKRFLKGEKKSFRYQKNFKKKKLSKKFLVKPQNRIFFLEPFFKKGEKRGGPREKIFFTTPTGGGEFFNKKKKRFS